MFFSNLYCYMYTCLCMQLTSHMREKHTIESELYISVLHICDNIIDQHLHDLERGEDDKHGCQKVPQHHHHTGGREGKRRRKREREQHQLSYFVHVATQPSSISN